MMRHEFPVPTWRNSAGCSWVLKPTPDDIAALNTEKELAACIVRAMELYKGVDIGKGEPAEYLRTGMRAAGYLPDWTSPGVRDGDTQVTPVY